MTTNQMPELLPCPFCGNDFEIETEHQLHGMTCLFCPSCGMRGPRHTSILKSTTAWNTRAQADLAQKTVTREVVDAVAFLYSRKRPADAGEVEAWRILNDALISAGVVKVRD